MNSKKAATIGLGLAIVLVLLVLNYRLTGSTDQHNNDFSWFWTAGHLLGQGLSPYDHQASAAALASIGSTRNDGLYSALAYPLWTVFLFVPLGYLDIDLAATLWLTLNQLLTGLTFYLIALALVAGQEPSRRQSFNRLFGWGLLPFLLSAHYIRSLLNGQFAIVSMTMAALFIYAVVYGRYRLAGLALIVVLLKPTTLVLFAPLALGWLLARPHSRPGALVFGVIGLVLALIGFGLDPQMLSHMYNAATPEGRGITFRNATLWGVCATVARNLGGNAAEIAGWAVAAGLGLMAAGLGWYYLKNMPPAPLRTVLGWSFVLVLSLNLTWYAFSYEAVILLLPLLAIVSLTQAYSRWEQGVIGGAVLVVIGVIPYLMNWTPLSEYRAGLFPALMLALLVGVLAHAHYRPAWQNQPVPAALVAA